jgi:DNA-binding transcriptional regulator GbsR (MarR family)
MMIFILAIATIFNKPIRRVISVPKQLVEGTHDNNFQDLSKENFSKEIVEDAKDQAQEVKENVLETTVGDIFTFISKGSKIKTDIQSLQKQTEEAVNSFDPGKYIPKKISK